MKQLRWWAIGLAASLGACSHDPLIPRDIQKMMETDAGRWALKSIEGHGGIWRWRQRAYATFDHALLVIARGMDTVITNRRRDTAITPRVDTLVNLRNHVVLDVQKGLRFAESVSQAPLIRQGDTGDSVWCARGDTVLTDSSTRARAARYLWRTDFQFSLPFTLLDSAVRIELVGEERAVDTVIQKGREPGTFDTTLTPYAQKKLRAEFPRGRSPEPWYLLYLDERSGAIRRVLTPASEPGATAAHRLTVWLDLQNVVGLSVGGRRLGYPADAEGRVLGTHQQDERFYNIDFVRELKSPPFTFAPRAAAAPADTAGRAAP